MSDNSREWRQLALEFALYQAGRLSRSEEFEFLARACHLSGYRGDSSKPITMGVLHQYVALSGVFQGLGSSVQELDQHAHRIAIFYPSFGPRLIGEEKLVTVVPIGLQPIIDVQVPGVNNYIAGGIVNHNCGKTVVGAFETTAHLTGRYPAWWEGRRFSEPVDIWASGDTSETTRDVVQLALMGPKDDMGTGMIPKRYLVGEPSARRGVADAVDQANVKHVSGGVSTLGFKSYDQGRKKFQGTKKHVIWLDEEPDAPIYDECMLRLMTTDGLMLCTFTPLLGLTEIALRFLPDLAPVLETGNVR
jgi:phage terminase large subunit-like protein